MKRIAFIVITLSVFLSLLGCDMPQSKSKSKSRFAGIQTNLKEVDKKLKNVKGIDYAFYEIYPDLHKYIKNESEYKEIYSDGKKIICYWYGSGCPYGQAFSNALLKFKNDQNYKDYYYFRPKEATSITITANSEEEMQIKNDFMLAKGTFCIINPEQKQIFSIDGVGREEAAQMKNILDELLDW